MPELPEPTLRAVRTTEDGGIGDLPSSSLPELSARFPVDAGSVDGCGSGDDCGSDLGNPGEDPADAFFCSDAKRLGYQLIRHGGRTYPEAKYYRDFGMIPPRMEERDVVREVNGLEDHEMDFFGYRQRDRKSTKGKLPSDTNGAPASSVTGW